MKKMLAIAMALMLCVSALSVCAFAAFDNVESLAIVGEGIPGVGSWDPADAAGDLTEVSDGVYEMTLDCPAGTSMNFKIAGNDAWDDTCNFGSATIVLGEVADLECGGGSGNMAFATDEDITIKITVDLTGETATILVADANAADDDTTTDGTDDTTTDGTDDTTTDGTDDTTTDTTAEPPVLEGELSGYYVTGNTDWLGNWTADYADGQMINVGDGICKIVFEDVPAGEYQLKVTNGTWDTNWGGDGPDGNYQFTVENDGYIVVCFNSNNGTIWVEGSDVGSQDNGNPGTGDAGMTGLVVLMVLASTAAVVISSKKKFF